VKEEGKEERLKGVTEELRGEVGWYVHVRGREGLWGMGGEDGMYTIEEGGGEE